MNIMAIAALGITAAALSAVIKKYNGEFSLFISLGASLLIMGGVLTAVYPLINLISELTDIIDTEAEYTAILMKALAVCYITQLASDCCRDSGETAIAGKVDFAGKIAVLLISVPLFEKLIGIIKGLML